VVEDGSNFSFNGGDYDNVFTGNNLHDLSVDGNGKSNSTGLAFLLQNASNNNYHSGGSIDRYGTDVHITNGNNNTFDSIDGEGWQVNGIVLDSSNLVAGNKFTRFRLETNWGPWTANAAVTVGLQIIDSNGNLQYVTTAGTNGATAPTWATTIGATTTSGTAVYTVKAIKPTDVVATGSSKNAIDVYQSGFETGASDTTGFNNYPHPLNYGSAAIPNNVQSFSAFSDPFHTLNMYINSTPGDTSSLWTGGCNDGALYIFGCLFVTGASGGIVEATREFVVCNSSLTTGCNGTAAIRTTASGHNSLTIPDASGTVMLSGLGQNATVAAVNVATVPGTNYNSGQIVKQGSWYTGQLGSGSYVSGITATGTTGQTCTLTGFNNGLTGATATVALTGTNTIASGTPLVVTVVGSGGSSATPPTTATAGNGSATCSGTANLSAVSIGAATNSFFEFVQTGTGSNPSQLETHNCNGSTGACSYFFETGGSAASVGSFNVFNPIAATSGANQAAPALSLIGADWNSTASATSNFRFRPSAASGASPLNTLIMDYSGPGTSELDLNYNTVKVNGTVIGTSPTRGVASLSSGTVTVSNSAACTVGGTCIYKLTNCGPNASTAIGTPSIGTIVAGTSFVINSLSATNTVVTGDVSTICWQIN
jgi:hypothetical protein